MVFRQTLDLKNKDTPLLVISSMGYGGNKMEETNKDLVNYETEAAKLEEAQNRPDFWNPKEGKHEVLMLSEMSFYEFTDKDDKLQKRAKLDVEVAGEKYVWSFGIGVTKASCYGQLVDHAKKHENKLDGVRITVVIKSDGKKRDFTIV